MHNDLPGAWLYRSELLIQFHASTTLEFQTHNIHATTGSHAHLTRLPKLEKNVRLSGASIPRIGVDENAKSDNGAVYDDTPHNSKP